MPRVKRGLVDGFVYHVLNRGNGREEVFHKDQDYVSKEFGLESTLRPRGRPRKRD
jgi:hypothetical protein